MVSHYVQLIGYLIFSLLSFPALASDLKTILSWQADGSPKNPKFFYELPECDDVPTAQPATADEKEEEEDVFIIRPRKRMYTRSNPPPDLHLFEDTNIEEYEDMEYTP